jgi:hypothetical protein
MAKSVFYSVELIHSENREEKIIKRSFENGNILSLRDQAFSYFKELFLIHEDKFLTKESVIPIKLTIYFNAGSKGRDLNYGQEIIFNRIHTSPIYILTFGKLEERGHSEEIDFIKKLTSDSELLDAPDIDKNIDLRSGESFVISFIRECIAQKDQNICENSKSNLQLIECGRCGKKMEVEQKVVSLFYSEKNRAYYSNNSWEVFMCCNSCVEIHYGTPKPYSSSANIYDKNGKSVYTGGRNLT